METCEIRGVAVHLEGKQSGSKQEDEQVNHEPGSSVVRGCVLLVVCCPLQTPI